MKTNLTLQNLMASHYNNGNDTMTLEFKVNGKRIFVNNIREFDKDDEFYWDEEESVKRAVEEARESDIEEA